MIALRKRGRPKGSRTHRPRAAQGMCIAGAATSAAKMNVPIGGTARHPNVWLWVPGEGWVRWVELHQQVTAAYERWRTKKSLQGIRVMDGWEWRQGQIEEALNQRAARDVAGARVAVMLQRIQREDAAGEATISEDDARQMGVWVDRDEAA